MPDRDESVPREPAEPVQRWRLVVRRVANPPEATVRDARGAWAQALVDSGLPVAGLDVVGGRPKLAVAAPLAAGVEGRRELVDLWLTARLPRWQVREALELHLPEGHTLVDLFDVWIRAPSLPGQVVASVYRCPLVDIAPALVAEAARGLLAADQLPRERPKGDSLVAYDLRPMVENATVEQAPDGRPELVMVLRHHPERGIGRPDELLAELSDRLESPAIRESASRLVRERIVLADDVPGPDAAGR